MLRTSAQDSALPLMKIKDYYSQQPDTTKSKINNKMINIIADYLEEEHSDEAMAMIDLYDLLAESDDIKRPDLYFIKGNIYAERKDSIMLKETIGQLEHFDGKKDYIDMLNNYLSQIRGITSSNYSLGGYWVSDILMTDIWGYGWNIPKYIIQSVDDKEDTNMTIETYCPFITKVCITTKGNLKIPAPQISQKFYPTSKDSLYIAWSSEKLKNYNAYLAGTLRQITGATAATISGELAQRHKYSTGEALLGGLINSFTEIGLNLLFDAIFTPSKKLYVLESKLKRVNDYILQGEFTYKCSKVKAGEENDPQIDTSTERVTLLKWTPESGVVFMSWNGHPLTPYPVSNTPIEKQKKRIEKAKKKGRQIDETILPYWKDLMNDTSTEYGKACQEKKKSKKEKEFIKQWNRKQIEKLRQYNLHIANGQ